MMMHDEDLEIINPHSTDLSKIYRDKDGQIFRYCSSFVGDVVRRFGDEFLFDRIVTDRVYLRKAAFHVSVSSWCSAQVSDYLGLSERLQNEMATHDAHLSDGHPWNFVFHHSEIKFVDFGSIRQGRAENDWYWSERAEYAPLETFFYISYCGQLRRRLAENVHEPAPIPHEQCLALGFRGLSDWDCHTSFAERFRRLGGLLTNDRRGKWIGYREEMKQHGDLVAEDPRCQTLIQILHQNPSIHCVVDVGANDGLHSRLCAQLGRDVLAFEIEDASASKLFTETKERKERITVACTTLRDYVHHLRYINAEFHPSIDLCLLFAVFHHMVHDFDYDFSILFGELEKIDVKTVLMEFIDYDDIHLKKVSNKKDWYSVSSLESFIATNGGRSTVFPQHERGRQLILIENVSQMYPAIRQEPEAAMPAAVTHDVRSRSEHDAAVARLEDITRMLNTIKRYVFWRYIPKRLKSLVARVLK